MFNTLCLFELFPVFSAFGLSVRTFWAGGVNTNHGTGERTEQSVRDPAGEVVSNPGAVRLRCESERTSVRSSSKADVSLDVTAPAQPHRALRELFLISANSTSST